MDVDLLCPLMFVASTKVAHLRQFTLINSERDCDTQT